MQQLPIFMNMQNQPALVVGGGSVAARKADLLIKAGAQVTVVSPQIKGEMSSMVANGHCVWIEACFAPDHLQQARLVIAATNDMEVNAQVSQLARELRVPVNVADQPELCTFILPAIIDRAPVTVAISTGGASPVLARYLRSRIEAMLPSGFGRLASLLGSFREALAQRVPKPDERRLFWEKIVEGPVAELSFQGRDDEARHALEQEIAAAGQGREGEVYLIGAGPGDPDLLTFKALRLLQKADVVVYDRLVSPEIVDLARREAERIYVGKARSHHSMKQEDISRLLASLAREGKIVARLKGGDPFIFGRGGEELEELVSQGIRYQVVPGITAAAGCAASSDIPLTHRDYAQSCRFITGHTKNGELDLDWSSLAKAEQTLVFYMGLSNLPEICSRLHAHGVSLDMPVAVVEKGTRPDQRVLTATLRDITEKVQEQGFQSPSLIIVGEVVKVRDILRAAREQGLAKAA